MLLYTYHAPLAASRSFRLSQVLQRNRALTVTLAPRLTSVHGAENIAVSASVTVGRRKWLIVNKTGRGSGDQAGKPSCTVLGRIITALRPTKAETKDIAAESITIVIAAKVDTETKCFEPVKDSTKKIVETTFHEISNRMG